MAKRDYTRRKKLRVIRAIGALVRAAQEYVAADEAQKKYLSKRAKQ